MPGMLDPFGMKIHKPRRVMVFIEEADGRMLGWEVLDPGPVSYRLTDRTRTTGSAHAALSVEGEFHRVAKDERSMAISAAMNRPPGIDMEPVAEVINRAKWELERGQ